MFLFTGVKIMHYKAIMCKVAWGILRRSFSKPSKCLTDETTRTKACMSRFFGELFMDFFLFSTSPNEELKLPCTKKLLFASTSRTSYCFLTKKYVSSSYLGSEGGRQRRIQQRRTFHIFLFMHNFKCISMINRTFKSFLFSIPLSGCGRFVSGGMLWKKRI